MIKYKELFIASLIIVSNFKQSASAQELRVKNNSDIAAIVSSKELSRIAFEDDEVETLYSSGEELTYKISGKDLYLRPNTVKPINFFVQTERGNTYKVLLTSKDIPSVQIFIKNVEFREQPTISSASYTSEINYRKKLSKIISASIADDLDMGFKKIEMDRSKKISGLKAHYDSDWYGEGLIASKYYLVNSSNNNIALSRAEYLKNEVEAVYIDRETLAPTEVATLITISNKK